MKIVQAHADGIEFREINAGTKIDSQMKDNGFNIKIVTDWALGFSFGGNKDNCGTWMDKMGSAPSNKGVPATPRDGAAIELVALQYSVLSFLGELAALGKFE
jgi:glycogen debranching enzyme